MRSRRCTAIFVRSERRASEEPQSAVGGLPQKGASLRVFLLGGTGLIGSAVARELVRRGHQLFGLARSGASAAKLDQFGVTPIIGDIGAPEAWVAALPPLDAVVHMACDFNTDMGGVDRRLLDRLLPALVANGTKPRFLYTGGCWLFGATGNEIASERTALCPCPPSPGWCRSSSACWPPNRSTASWSTPPWSMRARDHHLHRRDRGRTRRMGERLRAGPAAERRQGAARARPGAKVIRRVRSDRRREV